jgi:hypothetical protein
VRDILREGADIQPGLPDVPDLMRRGRAARRRHRTVVAVTSAAVLAAAIGVGTILIPRGDDSRPQPANPTRADPVPRTAGPLPAGAYDASALDIDLRFEVPGPGWTLATVADGSIGLRHGRSSVVLQRWDEVVDPRADPVGPTDTSLVPDDLVAWLSSHPRLEVLATAPVQLGDETWTSIELAVGDALGSTPDECHTLRCVLLAVSGDEPTELLARDRTRVLVGPGSHDGTDPVVVLARPTRARVDEAADDLVASLEPR